MGARQKLNGAHVNTAVVVGLVVWGISGSLPAGVIVAGCIFATSVYAGDIRPSSDRRPSNRIR